MDGRLGFQYFALYSKQLQVCSVCEFLVRSVVGFHERSVETRCGREPPFPRPPAAAEVAVLQAASCLQQAAKDQPVLLWELRGPTSPTDITGSSSISSGSRVLTRTP